MISEKRTLLLIGVFNLVLVIGSFWLIGDPLMQMKIRQDEKRLQDFSRIYFEVNNYYRDKKYLPKSLTLLNNISDITIDSETKKPYVYESKGENSYDLCTVFATNYSDFQKYSDYETKYMYDYNTKIEFIQGYSCINFMVPEYVINDNIVPPKPTYMEPTPVNIVPNLPTLDSESIDLIQTRTVPRSGSYSLSSASISKHKLILTVGFSSGCPKNPQTFKLYWQPHLRAKVPKLYLVFNDGENICEAYGIKQLEFDTNYFTNMSSQKIEKIAVVDSSGKTINLDLDLPLPTPSVLSPPDALNCKTAECIDIKRQQSKIIEKNKHCLEYPDDPTCTF